MSQAHLKLADIRRQPHNSYLRGREMRLNNLFSGAVLIFVLTAMLFLVGGCTTEYKQAKTQQPQYTEPSYQFPSSRTPTGRNTFVFSPRHHAYGLYNAHGTLVSEGRASGGKAYCSDVGRACKTPVGSFTIGRKKGPECVSSKFPLGRGGAPMPHCMFFHGGYAIHGSPHVPNYNASHGCIRVPPGDAPYLSSHLPVGSAVVVEPY